VLGAFLLGVCVACGLGPLVPSEWWLLLRNPHLGGRYRRDFGYPQVGRPGHC